MIEFLYTPSKLISRITYLSRYLKIWNLAVASEIALAKKYDYPLVVIPYLADIFKNDSHQLAQIHELIMRHAGSDLLLTNKCLLATEITTREINFGLITTNENILAVFLELMKLKREGLDINMISNDSPAYTRLCAAVHTGWGLAVLADHEAIMQELLVKDNTLFQEIKQLQIQVLNALNQNQSHSVELNELNTYLKQNEMRINSHASNLVLCGPQRVLRTLGSSFALAHTEYALLSLEEQKKDKVSINAILTELEIINDVSRDHVASYGHTDTLPYNPLNFNLYPPVEQVFNAANIDERTIGLGTNLR